MNYEINKFNEDLIKLINDSHLPVGIVYYVMKDCLGEVNRVYRLSLQDNTEDNPSEDTDI